MVGRWPWNWNGLGILVLLGLVGCGGSEPVEPVEPAADVVARSEGTRAMVQDLERLYRETQADALGYYYMNLEHAARIREQAGGRLDDMPPAMRRAYAVALLNGGDTAAAIEQIEALLRERGEEDALRSRDGRDLLALQAIAYLRLGEQQNCIAHPTADACILPLRASAIHRWPEGSRRAIDLYTRLLRRYRTDYASRWLLNVAYMTLGRYPDDVPPDLLIPGLTADTSRGVPRFPNVAGALGVDADDLAGGVAVEDFNRDGLLDIVATAHRLNDRIWFWVNDGQGAFIERSREAGLSGISGGLNILHADYDNDGFEDLLILRGGWLGERGQHPNSLLRNNGDGTFEDVTVRAGLLSYHPTQTAAWRDFDRDGWLDLFIGNEESDRWLQAWQGAGIAPPPEDRPHPCELYRNNGDGTFTEVAAQVGITLNAFVKGVAWGDVNNDGWDDLYVSVIGSPNRLYLNRGPQEPSGWRFEEAGAGVHEPFFSFPTWFFDYDHDGWEDLFVAPYDLRQIGEAAAAVAREYLGLPVETEMPRLYRNNGDGTFRDVSAEVGLNRVLFAMGSNFGDLDNDGFLDIYIGTGAPDLRSVIPNRMFRNVGGERFEEITFEGGFGHLQKGHAVAFADLDRDGDQDIYAAMGGAYEGDGFANVLFENPGYGARHAWVALRLEGRRANRSAIGARIRITVTNYDGSRRQIHRTVSTGGSFGASSLQQEIGLGEAQRIDEVHITWPNRERTVDVITDIVPNRSYTIVEGRAEAEPVPAWPVPFRVAGTSPSRAGSSHGAH